MQTTQPHSLELYEVVWGRPDLKSRRGLLDEERHRPVADVRSARPARPGASHLTADGLLYRRHRGRSGGKTWPHCFAPQLQQPHGQPHALGQQTDAL